MLNLRSVVAQVHRNSRSIWSRRNLSNQDDWEAHVKVLRLRGRILSRFIGIPMGCGIARYIWGDISAKFEEQLLEDLRETEESLKKTEQFWRNRLSPRQP